MPYSSVTLQTFVDDISDLMDDTAQVYWTVPEIAAVTWEGLYMLGALTNYWRARGSFTVSPSHGSPFYDLATELPLLRTRTWTLGQMVSDIQYMLLEPQAGISGAGMTGQVGISSILQAIQDARNRFVRDCRMPYTYHGTPYATSLGGGLYSFSQNAVYVHRASWLETNGAWRVLWRDDAWGADKNNVLWTSQPGVPQAYSEAELAPLMLQLIPPSLNVGSLDAVTVDSITMLLSDSSALFQVPDEWVHAIKYAALSQILGSEGQIKDNLRGNYCESRYQLAVQASKDAYSMIRCLIDGVPLALDSESNIDATNKYWRNQTGRPRVAGATYDMLTISPGIPMSSYTLTVDVSQAAPIPTHLNDYMPVGLEVMDGLKNYVCHILSFKCGGNEFQSSYDGFKEFASMLARQRGINKALIPYLEALFNQPQQEQSARPDYKESE